MEYTQEQKRNFRENLEYNMRLKGKKRNGLATALKVPNSVVYGWSYTNPMPDEKELKLLADYFGVTPESFFIKRDRKKEISRINQSIIDEINNNCVELNKPQLREVLRYVEFLKNQ